MHKPYYCYYFPTLLKIFHERKCTCSPALHSLLSGCLSSSSFLLFHEKSAPASQGRSSQILGACLPGAPSEPFSMSFLPPGTPSPSSHSTLNSSFPFCYSIPTSSSCHLVHGDFTSGDPVHGPHTPGSTAAFWEELCNFTHVTVPPLN